MHPFSLNELLLTSRFVREISLTFFCPSHSRTQTGETALHVAGRYGQIEAAQLLISLDVNSNLQDEDGETPLHITVWHGYTAIVKTLCTTAGTNVDLKNKVRVCGGDSVVRLYVNSNLQDEDGRDTLLHITVWHGYTVNRSSHCVLLLVQMWT